MRRYELVALLAERDIVGRAYLEFERTDVMSAGVYVLPVGGTDGQSPHDQDEVYVVVRGRARFTAGDAIVDVCPGDTLYVERGVPHRFHDITEELVLTVVFSPPET